MLTGDELRKVQRCEEKSEEINNELEFKKEKVEWEHLNQFEKHSSHISILS